MGGWGGGGSHNSNVGLGVGVVILLLLQTDKTTTENVGTFELVVPLLRRRHRR